MGRYLKHLHKLGRAGALCLAIVVLAGLGAVFVHMLIPSEFAEITDASRYAEVLQRMGYPRTELAHFPASLPSGAGAVRLYFCPLIAGGELQVRMKLPPSQIAALRNQFSSLAREVRDGGRAYDGVDEGGLPSIEFRNAANTGFASLPSEFTVFILDARPRVTSSGAGTTRPSWNHGVSYGVAIDEKLFEVIYWAGEW